MKEEKCELSKQLLVDKLNLVLTTLQQDIELNRQAHQVQLDKLRSIIHDQDVQNKNLKNIIQRNRRVKIQTKEGQNNKNKQRKISTFLSRKISDFQIQPVEGIKACSSQANLKASSQFKQRKKSFQSSKVSKFHNSIEKENNKSFKRFKSKTRALIEIYQFKNYKISKEKTLPSQDLLKEFRMGRSMLLKSPSLCDREQINLLSKDNLCFQSNSERRSSFDSRDFKAHHMSTCRSKKQNWLPPKKSINLKQRPEKPLWR